jgi:hypothetical protein
MTATTGPVTDAMLTRAMMRAVEVGIFPSAEQHASYLRKLRALRAVLEAAISTTTEPPRYP